MLLYILVLQARPQIQNKVHQIPQKLEWKFKHVLYLMTIIILWRNAFFLNSETDHQQ